MNVRHRTIGTDGPGSPPLRLHPARIGWWWAPALGLSLLGTPTPAEASPGFFARLLTAPADTSRAPAPIRAPVANAHTWELIRESTNRLLEPETRILRYTARYTVSKDIARKIVEEANAVGVDPELAFRLVRVESRFHARARSPQGALGLMQLMPSTARVLDRSLTTDADILDPRTNLRLGLRYLRSMIDRYDDVRLGLLAYNRGPGAVDRALQRGQDPENGYSRKVLGTGLNRYRGEGLIPRTTPAPAERRAVERRR
jgi:soluble lytic murein transglycosylase-like protein